MTSAASIAQFSSAGELRRHAHKIKSQKHAILISRVVTTGSYPYPIYEREIVGRFGGWEAKWLAQVIMMTSDASGVAVENGMKYTRKARSGERGMTQQYLTVEATIYIVGLVDIDTRWINTLIPDEKKRAAFLKGDKDGFFADQ